MKATRRTASLLVTSAVLIAEGNAQPAPSPQKPSVDQQVRDGQARGGTASGEVVGRWSSNIFSLIRAESVQKELVLTEDQKLKLAPLIEEYDMGLVELSKQPIPEPGNRPSQKERSKAFEERHKKADDLLQEKARGVTAVLTAEQSVRLSQIMLQKERGNALNESDVQAKLSITSEQQRKLREISNAFGGKVVEAMRNSRKASTPRTMTLALIKEQRDALETLARERDAAMMAVLTPTQVEQFQSLRGKEFDVKSLDSTINPSSR